MIENKLAYLTISVGDYYTGAASSLTVTCLDTVTSLTVPTSVFDGTVTKISNGLFRIAIVLPLGSYMIGVMCPAFSSTLWTPVEVLPDTSKGGTTLATMVRELWQVNGLDSATVVTANDLDRQVVENGVPIMVQQFTDDGVTDTMQRI